MKSPPVRHVLLVGLAYYGVDEAIRKGLNQFRESGRRWWLMEAGHDRTGLQSRLQERTPDGILAHLTDEQIEEQLAQVGCPIVNLSGSRLSDRFPNVIGDNRLAGRMAADYLLARGHTRFVYCSEHERFFEKQRWQGFAQRLAEAGHSAVWNRAAAFATPTGAQLGTGQHWLLTTPKPLAIYCAVDRLAARLTDEARSLDLIVPEQLAVLGTDNFESLCLSSTPSLSSVAVAGQRIGRRAAEILELLMSGAQVPSLTTVAPAGVVERRSTQSMAVADPVVAKALSYLAENAACRITVSDMVKRLNMPLRTLQRRFKQVVGHTPLEELFGRRVQLAKRRLETTDDSIYAIAIESGFADAEAFSTCFKRHLGLSPSQYRREHRGSGKK